ncbi:hypothetical protein HN748_03385 [Candidatus Peregrinibacteria bacterium]|nr:hypothetical protein [Candidatus Peregrinibacteria bacterium]MBT7484242.1 hypothetical protein [Candidatus Peregrinibacteria bacterium]MBT7703251.1 hypothetical protein [Candidatus Peregrinibacteria bacterium]
MSEISERIVDERQASKELIETIRAENGAIGVSEILYEVTLNMRDRLALAERTLREVLG